MPDLLDRLKTALADRYAIQEELGAGGMATVYLAEDLKHHRKVAVKVLRPELAAVVGAERFLQEIQIAAKLSHPHILTLIDSGEAEGFLYYVMPYVEGESLREKLAGERQLSIEEAVAITQDVASALGYAHSQGVIHRDVKPGNILMHEGEAIVADFGIALALHAAAGQRLTETGLSLGTPQYMSPEQATADHEIDARSDVYSLAAVLYEMLAGDPPFTGRSTQAVIAKLLTERPTPVRILRDTVPEAVEQAVMKALAKVPADRFDKATQFGEVLATPSVITGGSSPQATSSRRRARKMAWMTAVAAVAVAAVMVTRPDPTLLSTGVLQERDRILIADFANRTRDSSLGLVVAEALRIDMSQSRAVRVMTPRGVSAAASRMRLDLGTMLTPTIAQEIAEREGLKAYVIGEIGSAGPSYVLTARIVGTSEGEILAAARETAEDSVDLVGAVDRLSATLRRSIGESLRNVRTSPPLARVSTASLPALRNYTLGLQASQRNDYPLAFEYLEEAVRLDTAFAMGYRKLAAVGANVQIGLARRREWATLAYQHRDHLPDVERYQVEARYHIDVEYDRDKVINAYRRIIEISPDDVGALVNLSNMLSFDPSALMEAERHILHAITLDDLWQSYGNAIAIQLSLGKIAEAETTLATFEARMPDNPRVVHSRLTLAGAQRDYVAASRWLDSLLVVLPQLGNRAWSDRLNLLLVRGRTREYREQLEQIMAITLQRGGQNFSDAGEGQYIGLALRAAEPDLLYGNPNDAVQYVEAALRQVPLESMSTEQAELVKIGLVGFYARAGRLSVAIGYFDSSYTTNVDAGIFSAHSRIWLAIAEERFDDAIEFGNQLANRRPRCSPCGRFELAIAFDRAGQPDSAIAAFERAITYYRTQYGIDPADALYLPLAYYRLGELHAQRGDDEEALQYYGAVLDLWDEADDAHASWLDNVRAAVARLEERRR